MTKFTLLLIYIMFDTSVYAAECNELTLTVGTYAETEDLIGAIQGEYGNNYSLGDWTELQAISDIDGWISCMGFEENQTFLLTNNGDHYFSGNRHYYVHYSSDGLPYPSFVAHDQIGDKLWLGSWYDLDMNILAKNVGINTDCAYLKLTTSTYPETDDLEADIQEELGNDYTLGDWTDIMTVTDIDQWILCLKLQEDQTFLLTNGGQHYWSGNRHYYVHYSSDGLPYPNFIAHDQIGGKLWLGSWYGLNMNILARNLGLSSIAEKSHSKALVYPNPIRNKLTIEYQGNINGEVSISNTFGQILIREEMSDDYKLVNMTAFSKGLYFVVLKDAIGNIVSSWKIIKN